MLACLIYEDRHTEFVSVENIYKLHNPYRNIHQLATTSIKKKLKH